MKTFSFVGILSVFLVAGQGRAAITETVSSATLDTSYEISGMVESGVEDHSVLAFPSITNQRTAKTVPSSGCTPVPAAATSFSSTDAYVYLFFNISGQVNGEQLTRIWYSPDGKIATSGAWPAMTSGGGYCPWVGLQIAGTPTANKTGTWRVVVYSNKITDVPYVDLSFTITSSGGGGGGFPTITNARMAKSVPQGTCTPVPAATTSFSSTDAYAYLFFSISGHASGEGLSNIWYSPDGQIASRGAWDPLPAGGSYCLKSSLQIAGAAAASKPGAWRVVVYSDKITDVPYVDLTFTITSSGGGGGGGGVPTITNARMAKSVPQGTCTPVPAATTSFSSADAYAYLFFSISGHASGEGLSNIWYSPDGQIASRGAWDPLPAGGSYCLKSSLQIAGAAAASKPGTWRVVVYSDRITDVPYVDLTFTLTSSGGGGGSVAGTWLLTSSARAQGAGAFWQTDLTIRNTGTSSANVTIKFLGHSGDGRSGPEQLRTIPGGQTQTWRDVLGSLFNLSSEYGPILIRSTSASLAVLGQTWTKGGAGTYGQSVPVLATSELIGSTPRSILGVRQDTFFRTNLMLANATESAATVTVQLVSIAGAVLATKSVSLGPLSRAQYNVGTDFGYTNLADAVFVISSPTPGAAIGAYASVIDAGTADPRTLLPR